MQGGNKSKIAEADSSCVYGYKLIIIGGGGPLVA